MTFKPLDRWQAFVDEGWRLARIDSGFTDESQCQTVIDARSIGEVTVRDGVSVLPKYADLQRWVAANLLSLFDAEMRLIILKQVAALPDKPFCAVLYNRQADLTDEEDAVLFEAFAPEMPVLVEKITSGTNVRAKQ